MGWQCGFNFHSQWSIVGMAPFSQQKAWESGRSVFETQTPRALSELLRFRLRFLLCEVGTETGPAPRWKVELWEMAACMNIVLSSLLFPGVQPLVFWFASVSSSAPHRGISFLVICSIVIGCYLVQDRRSGLVGRQENDGHSSPCSGFRGAWPLPRQGQPQSLLFRCLVRNMIVIHLDVSESCFFFSCHLLGVGYTAV